MSIRVGLIQINVTDLGEAWRFYIDTLGFQGSQGLGPGKPFEIEAGEGVPTVLVYPVESVAARGYPHDTGVTLVFHTDDLRGTVERWRAKGVAFVPIAWSADDSGIADTPFGPFIAFRDPFGNVHELLEPGEGDGEGQP